MGISGEHNPRRILSVSRIALAAQSAARPIRTVDLEHLHAALAHMASKPCAVRARTLNASTGEPPKRACPFDQLLVSNRRRRNRVCRNNAADDVDQHRYMHVEVRINT